MREGGSRGAHLAALVRWPHLFSAGDTDTDRDTRPDPAAVYYYRTYRQGPVVVVVVAIVAARGRERSFPRQEQSSSFHCQPSLTLFTPLHPSSNPLRHHTCHAASQFSTRSHGLRFWASRPGGSPNKGFRVSEANSGHGTSGYGAVR